MVMSLRSNQMDPGEMKALIVDDEPIARRVLREELELFPEVRVVGEAGDGKEALQKISETPAGCGLSRSADASHERV